MRDDLVSRRGRGQGFVRDVHILNAVLHTMAFQWMTRDCAKWSAGKTGDTKPSSSSKSSHRMARHPSSVKSQVFLSSHHLIWNLTGGPFERTMIFQDPLDNWWEGKSVRQETMLPTDAVSPYGFLRVTAWG